MEKGLLARPHGSPRAPGETQIGGDPKRHACLWEHQTNTRSSMWTTSRCSPSGELIHSHGIGIAASIGAPVTVGRNVDCTTTLMIVRRKAPVSRSQSNTREGCACPGRPTCQWWALAKNGTGATFGTAGRPGAEDRSLPCCLHRIVQVQSPVLPQWPSHHPHRPPLD